jgi:hypothetical protein
VTLSLAPGLLMGPAPPADAPPGPGTVGPATSKAGDPSAPSAFAALLQAVTAGQSGGETAPPIGGTPSLLEAPPLMELLARVLAGHADDITEAATGSADELGPMHLLDRFAEAGTNTADAPALEGGTAEALMAYLVMAQRTLAAPEATPALPVDVLRLAARRDVLPGDPSVHSDLAPDADVDLAGFSGGAASMMAAGADEGDEPAALAVAGINDAETVDGDEAPAQGVTLDGTARDDSRRGSADRAATASADSIRPSADRADARISETPEARVTGRPEAQAGQTDADAPNGLPFAPMASVAGSTPRVETVTAARVVDAASLPAEVADTVRMAAFRGDSEVRLVLNPPELGHLDIRIASGDGGLRITLEASQSGARELIDRSLVQLQQALEARDLRIDRLEVRAADTGRGMDASGQQSGGFGTSDEGGNAPEWSPVAALGLAGDGSVDGAGVADGVTQPSTADGRVDVMA